MTPCTVLGNKDARVNWKLFLLSTKLIVYIRIPNMFLEILIFFESLDVWNHRYFQYN